MIHITSTHLNKFVINFVYFKSMSFEYWLPPYKLKVIRLNHCLPGWWRCRRRLRLCPVWVAQKYHCSGSGDDKIPVYFGATLRLI